MCRFWEAHSRAGSLITHPQHVRKVPERDHTLLARQLLVEYRRVEHVLLGLTVQLAQPFVACGRIRSRLETAEHDHPEDRPHRAGRERIADEDLSLPARLEHLVPVSRHLTWHQRLGVVGNDRRLINSKLDKALNFVETMQLAEVIHTDIEIINL